jgi:hypothetical protein
MISTGNFVRASAWYGSVDEAQILLAENPAIADSNIYTAALLGNVTAIKRYLKEEPGLATAKGEALGWDALTYLCFSKFLRIYPPEAFIGSDLEHLLGRKPTELKEFLRYTYGK